jgi:hypothetical protein
MTDQSELWTAVKVSYNNDGLIPLTRGPSTNETTVDDTAGTDAALGVINLWPAYAQEAYDSTNALHVEVAKQGVIAMLWRRGGSSTKIEQVKWDSVFSPEGIIAKVKRTGPRGHEKPQSNSNITQASGLSSTGKKKRAWADVDSLPSQGQGIMPSDTLVD